ncbi:hypothetical protein [Pseudomonas reinekei]|jgi:hypothetical protein|uniref:Uncharacterized protein n=1 Tax=Pseudomonas reinekei TaxID=395598 RepID=A0A1Q9WPH8_PSERE|nr:hypothetical protein [Pseudomonas reinekei]KAB0483653.1 hypothetical protein F7R15_20070 [Pseudomonas reinekei]OLU00684.1 hypothetical protein BVK86_21025 [Pseudomonas reinekei]
MADALTVHARRGAGSLLDRPQGPVLPKYSYNVIRKCNTKIELMCLIGRVFSVFYRRLSDTDGAFYPVFIELNADFRALQAFVGKAGFK